MLLSIANAQIIGRWRWQGGGTSWSFFAWTELGWSRSKVDGRETVGERCNVLRVKFEQRCDTFAPILWHHVCTIRVEILSLTGRRCRFSCHQPCLLVFVPAAGGDVSVSEGQRAGGSNVPPRQIENENEFLFLSALTSPTASGRGLRRLALRVRGPRC